jgi:hypothetical protein
MQHLDPWRRVDLLHMSYPPFCFAAHQPQPLRTLLHYACTLAGYPAWTIEPARTSDARPRQMASPPTRRSRGACATCKSRRRKCDETHPACIACSSRGVTCGGYETRLRWGTGIASRGQFTGASAPLVDAIPQRPRGRRRDLLKAERPGRPGRAAVGRGLGVDLTTTADTGSTG